MVSSDKTITLLVQDIMTDDKFYHIEIAEDATVEELKCLIAIQSTIDPERQVLTFRAQVLRDDSKKIVDHYGIRNNDMVNLQVVNPQAQQMMGGARQGITQDDQALLRNFFGGIQQQQQQQGFDPNRSQRGMFNQMFHNAQQQRIRAEADKIRALYQQDPNFKIRIAQSDPEMNQALASNNMSQLESVVGKRLKEQMDKKKEEQERLFRLQNAAPDDVEAQKQIEELIRKNMVEDNYQNALENCPEFFGRVTMLYIDTKVNGTPVQAFVDSGAQATIISKDCAERCNLMRLLDTRFAGMAVGVGQSRILGRIHIAEMRVIEPSGKEHTLQCSFTVLEDNKVDLLFGLDNLKRHQCAIDLVDSRLHFNKSEFSVPFLSEGQIKPDRINNPELQRQSSTSSDQGAQEGSVKELCDMGFTRQQAVEALRVCGNNKEMAANFLLQGSQSR